MNKLFSIFSLTIYLFFTFTNHAISNDDTIYHKKDYKKDYKNSAILQGINKITARVSSLNISKDEKENFGNLEIELIKCWSSPPEQEPDNKALIKIWEQVPGEEKKEIFFGWMFSSSPALSALEHPVYDIVLKSCLNIEKPTQYNISSSADDS
jgi:hypothetical protein